MIQFFENWRTPGLPTGNYYAPLGCKYPYVYDREPWISLSACAICGLIFRLQKLTETLWSLWPVELPGVTLLIIFTNKKVIPATGRHFRKVRLAFCRFSCQRTERWQIHCSKTHSPGRATSWQVLLVRHRCSLANASGRVEFYTPALIAPKKQTKIMSAELKKKYFNQS